MANHDRSSWNRPSRRFAVLALVAVLLGPCIWWVGRERDRSKSIVLGHILKAEAATSYNLLMITLDTTRADHLGCYGNRSVKTPTIDSLLERGVRFDHAFTNVPLTAPAHATIMTGLEPRHHGVRNNGRYRLPSARTTMAEVLQKWGYSTAAFVSCFVLDKRFGLDQGFDSYDFRISDRGLRGPQSLENERDAKHVTDAGLQWLEGRTKTGAKAPFFLWMHYFDPHLPYDSPLATRASPSRGTTPAAAYDAEIEFVDQQLARLLRALEEQHLRHRTLIVLVSDHGESLGEHGEQDHGAFIYDATVRIAFLMSCPTLFDAAYRVDDRVVGAVDIMPTITELLNVPCPNHVDGLSLLKSKVDPDRAVYLETLYTQEDLACAPLFGLRRLHDKFILAPRSEYYDLRNDPGETHNLYESAKHSAKSLEQQLRATLGENHDTTASPRRMSAQEKSHLASLGYVSVRTGMSEEDLPDPKDRVAVLGGLRKAARLKELGKFDEALTIAEQVAEQASGVDLPVLMIAELHTRLGRTGEAIRVLREFANQYESVDALVGLAGLCYHAKRYDEMELTLQTVLKVRPECGTAHLMRGDRFFDEGRYRDAVRSYMKALKLDRERIEPLLREKLQEARKRAEQQSI